MSRITTSKKVTKVETETTIFCDLCSKDLDTQDDESHGRKYEASVERVMFIYPYDSDHESYDVCYECWGKHVRPIFNKEPNRNY